jgi:hypothetical protein
LWYKLTACLAFLPGPYILSIERTCQTPVGLLVIGLIEVGVGYAILISGTTNVRIEGQQLVITDIFRSRTMNINSISSITKSEWDQSYILSDSYEKRIRLSYYIAGIDELVRLIKN